MATDIAIASLPVLTTVASGDILPIVDISDLTDPGGTTKGTTAGALLTGVVYGVFNVRDPLYGAVGNGVADDTAAIQAAVNAAQAFIPSLSTFAPQAPSVYVPSGKYKIAGTILITRPIRFWGEGWESTQFIGATANIPVIHVQQTLSQSTYVTYDLDHFQITGLNTNYSVQDAQDGILVETTTNDITPRISWVRVVNCTGHGINCPDKCNSPSLHNIITENNSKSGIHLATTASGFCTNMDLDTIISRQNRQGIHLDGNVSAPIVGGRLRNVLLESNNGGISGTIQSADRPSIGLRLGTVNYVTFDTFYCENHANDLYADASIAYNTFRRCLWETGSCWELPGGAGVGYGGPAVRQLGVYITGGLNNRFIDCVSFSYPTKPGDVSDANWNTATFGASYPHVTDLAGTNYYESIGLGGPAGNGPLTVTPSSAGNLIRNRYSVSGQLAESWATNDASQEIKNLQRTLVIGSGKSFNDVVTLPTTGSTGYFRQTFDGTATTVNVEYMLQKGLFQQRWTSTGTDQYLTSWSNAAPTTGAHTVGEMVVNTAPATGAPFAWRCTSSGTPGTWVGLYFPGAAALATSAVAFNNGAAAAVGTLTNAPAAGNPTKWVPINDNGTTRYIPAW